MLVLLSHVIVEIEVYETPLAAGRKSTGIPP